MISSPQFPPYNVQVSVAASECLVELKLYVKPAFDRQTQSRANLANHQHDLWPRQQGLRHGHHGPVNCPRQLTDSFRIFRRVKSEQLGNGNGHPNRTLLPWLEDVGRGTNQILKRNQMKFFINFFLKGPIPASFCIFSSFSNYNFKIQIEKSVDGVLGIQTQGRRMVGADKTTELWRPPKFIINFIRINHRHRPIDVASYPDSYIGSYDNSCNDTSYMGLQLAHVYVQLHLGILLSRPDFAHPTSPARVTFIVITSVVVLTNMVVTTILPSFGRKYLCGNVFRFKSQEPMS